MEREPEHLEGELEDDGTITQEFVDKHYPAWMMRILPTHRGLVNNNLMANINPEQAGARALARVPLCSRFMYAYEQSAPADPSQAEVLHTRVNRFLAQDINALLTEASPAPRVARSNFSAESPYFTAEPLYYVDQRDAPIELESIPAPK